jgi:hypothetical protein
MFLPKEQKTADAADRLAHQAWFFGVIAVMPIAEVVTLQTAQADAELANNW